MHQRPKSDEAPSLPVAILQAAAYADLFDYPLTAYELHRYLVCVPASLGIVQATLMDDRLLSRRLTNVNGFFTLRGREIIVETRRRRTVTAGRLWRRARWYGSAMARLPYVRMVGVTGALAVDNVEAGTDIDYLVVTEPGRLWLCRAFVVALVRLAARFGDELCPNYFLSEGALIVPERSLFTAHELAQMVPLSGFPTYRRMRQINAWAADYLPNSFGESASCLEPKPFRNEDVAPVHDGWRSSWRLAEAALACGSGTWLEHWEMDRKLRKFGVHSNTFQSFAPPSEPCVRGDVEVSFSADRCKGHFRPHGQIILDLFAERLRSLDLPFPAPAATGSVRLSSEQGGVCW